jgi:hypothetical protein
MFAVFIQIVTGFWLVWSRKCRVLGFFDRIQTYSGLYFTIFFVIHLSAIWWGRIILKLDTNIYFGVAGLNTYPFFFFFIPYYSLAILAFFCHVAAIHTKKMKKDIFSISPYGQAYGILALGFIITIIILFSLTNGFSGIEIPPEYNVIIQR